MSKFCHEINLNIGYSIRILMDHCNVFLKNFNMQEKTSLADRTDSLL